MAITRNNGKKDVEKTKPFRPTPIQFQNSLKILAGTKTNATIRDIEEDENELVEMEGVVISIDRNKINGNGWNVRGTDGATYQCSCAGTLYQIPSTIERGGILYPKDTISVKFTINSVLRKNTITEFTSSGETLESLDLTDWTHGEEATTILAKPKSAISISDSMIKFNYNNTNQIIADEESINIEGKETNINTDSIQINTSNVKINNKKLNSIVKNEIAADSSVKHYTDKTMIGTNFYIDMERNLSQISFNSYKINLIKNIERVILDIEDQVYFPIRDQSYRLNDNILLTIYTDGLVTLKSNINQDFLITSTNNWMSPQYSLKNCITINYPNYCKCCNSKNKQSIFINYCPVCHKWNVLLPYAQNIICNDCQAIFCGNCGHNLDNDCKNINTDLKIYNDFKISSTKKEYVNYCPKCNSFNYIIKNEKNFHCTMCQTSYDYDTGINILGKNINSFLDTEYSYLNYRIRNNKQKMFFIQLINEG